MKKRFCFLILFLTIFIEAQTDIEEQIYEVKAKADKLNVFMNFQTSFDANFNQDEKEEIGFQGVMSRVEVRGNLNEKLFYRVRYRLNRSAVQTSQDNLSGAADMALVGYRFNDKWSATFGKMGQNWGGFEYDLNPMNIYDYSDYVYNTDAFLTGAMLYYRHNDKHDFSFNLNNISIKKMEERYGKSDDETVLPFSSVFTWIGKFDQGKIQTRWSLGYHQQRKGKSSKMLILGNKFFFPKWNIFVDYSFAQEDLDRLGYASAYTDNSVVYPKYWENVWYHSVVSRLEYKIRENWIYSLQGILETADVRHLPLNFKNNKRRGFGYFTGVEWLPVQGQNLSIYANYSWRWYHYQKQEMNNYTNRFSLGVIYRIKAF